MTLLRLVWRRVRHVHISLGHRGRSLLFFAVLAAGFAASLVGVPDPGSAVTDVVPLPVWAALWAVVAAVCVAGALRIRDRVAYGTVAGMMTLWGLLYLWEWLFGYGAPRGWIFALIYLAFGAFAVNIATWPEHVPPAELLGTADAVVTIKDDGVITGWFGAAQAIFGWSAVEVIGQPVTVIVPHRLRQPVRDALADLERTGRSVLAGRTVDVYGLNRDGHEVALSMYMTAADTGDGRILSAVIRPSPTYGPPWGRSWP